MTVGALILVTVVKLVALLVASGSGFRGGRIFPSVFVGVGVGLIANSLFPDIPVALAVAAGVMGLTLVSARDGWLALFLGVASDRETSTCSRCSSWRSCPSGCWSRANPSCKLCRRSPRPRQCESQGLIRENPDRRQARARVL